MKAIIKKANEAIATEADPLKDRSVGLTVFGTLDILLGIFCFSLAMLLLVVVSSTGLQALRPIHYWMAMGFLFCSTGWYIVLGLGSIKAKRWARALLAMPWPRTRLRLASDQLPSPIYCLASSTRLSSAFCGSAFSVNTLSVVEIQPPSNRLAAAIAITALEILNQLTTPLVLPVLFWMVKVTSTPLSLRYFASRPQHGSVRCVWCDPRPAPLTGHRLHRYRHRGWCVQ